MHTIAVQGEQVPALGLGTWQLRGEVCREAVRHALELGYRHLDTARLYGNEAQVGAGLSDSRVDPDEVFVVTKVPARSADRRGVERAVAGSLKELQVDVIDLVLLHQPARDVPIGQTVDAFLQEQHDGRIRHFGVSNFSAGQLRAALDEGPVFAVQNEYHPGVSDDAVIALCRERDVLYTAYSPLDRGNLLAMDVLEDIGAAHGKTAAQVAIRWLLQQEKVSTIPRSSAAEHRAENLDVFDFALSDEEMARISALA